MEQVARRVVDRAAAVRRAVINVDLIPAAPTVVVDGDVVVDKGNLATDRSR
jgi:hypothetical protein